MSHVVIDRCDLPPAKPKLRGTIWVCSCGKTWTLQRQGDWGDIGARVYIADDLAWFLWPKETRE